MSGPNFGKSWGDENCYWYAVHHTRTAADGNGGMNPGEWSSQNINVNNAADIDAAVIADGGVRACPQLAPVQPPLGSMVGHYLVAAKCGGGNYHFMRRDETTGIWYQKVPMSSAGPVDSTNNIVPHTGGWTPPKIAVALPAYLGTWVGYYWVPNTGLPVPLAPAAPAPSTPMCCVLM